VMTETKKIFLESTVVVFCCPLCRFSVAINRSHENGQKWHFKVQFFTFEDEKTDEFFLFDSNC
jgi:hypothetical protein